MDKQVTIIIVTYNARNLIADCLESVYRQNYPKSKVKIIIVDNNSRDNTVAYIKEVFPEVKVIENKTKTGFATANNQGYFLSKKQGSDYLVLLNQDTVVEANWLKHMTKVLESKENIGAVQPKLLLHPQTDLINSFGNKIHYLGFGYCDKYKAKNNLDISEPFEVSYPSGAAVIIKMIAIQRAGGLFDDDLFMYHEDVDFGWRLRLAGFKVLLDPLSVVYHKYTFSKAKYKYYYMERNRLIVILENYRIATLIVFSPMFLVMELGQLFFALKNGWIIEKLKGYGWILLHLHKILFSRLNKQFKIRKIKDEKIIRLFTGSITNQEVNYPFLVYIINPIMEMYFRLAKIIIFW